MRGSLAVLAALVIAACNTSPTSPTSSTLGPSAGGSATLGALDKPQPDQAGQPCPDPADGDRDNKGHCHGDDSGGDPPEQIPYSASGDVLISLTNGDLNISNSNNAVVLGTCCGGEGMITFTTAVLNDEDLEPDPFLCFAGQTAFSFTGALREFNNAQDTLQLRVGFHAADSNGKIRDYELLADTPLNGEPFPPTDPPTLGYTFSSFDLSANGNAGCTGVGAMSATFSVGPDAP